MFHLGGSVLRKHQRGFKTEKGKQPVKCVIKPPNWDLGASINQHMPQTHSRGARELGQGWGGEFEGEGRPAPNSLELHTFWPAPGYKRGSRGRRRPSGKEAPVQAVGGQACEQP